MICSVDQDVVVADTDTKPLGGENVSFVSSYGLCGAQRIERSSTHPSCSQSALPEKQWRLSGVDTNATNIRNSFGTMMSVSI